MSTETLSVYGDQPKLIRFLDLSFFALTVLTVAGTGIYLMLLDRTLQNGYPVLLTALFAALVFYYRTKVLEAPEDYERLKQIFRIWIIITIVSSILVLFVIFTYPI